MNISDLLIVEDIRRRFRKEPARLHPEDLQLIIERIEKIMSDALNRITASVTRLIDDVASELRNHPAAQSDDGALNALADKLDAASTDLEAANAPPADPQPASDTSGQAQG